MYPLIWVPTTVKTRKAELCPTLCLAIWLLFLNKGECNINQSKDDSVVERVAKNNSWNNGNRHKIYEIFLIKCFAFVITLVWKTVHSSAMTQIKAHLMEKTLQLTAELCPTLCGPQHFQIYMKETRTQSPVCNLNNYGILNFLGVRFEVRYQRGYEMRTKTRRWIDLGYFGANLSLVSRILIEWLRHLSSSSLRSHFVVSLLPKENGRKLVEKTSKMSIIKQTTALGWFTRSKFGANY